MAAKPSPPAKKPRRIDRRLHSFAAIVEGLFGEIAKYGVASLKRIDGEYKADSPIQNQPNN